MMVKAPVYYGVNFWNLALTRSEIIIFIFGFVTALTLHLSPVLNSGAAKPILIFFGFVSFLRPATGFFFIGAASILPTAPAELYALQREMAAQGMNAVLTDSGTKFAFISWLLAVVFRYHRLRLVGLKRLTALLPLLLWLFALFGPAAIAKPDLVKSLAFCVMAAQLANEANGQYLKCLLSLGVGLLVATFGFWAYQAGLPIELSSWGNARGGFERLGSIGTDSVMLWPPILISIGILLGTVASFGSPMARCRRPKWLLSLAGVGVLMSLPPLMASMTNAGYFGFAALMLVFLMAIGHSVGQGQVNTKLLKRVFALMLSLVLVLALLISTNTMQLGERLSAYLGFYEELQEDVGVAGSRGFVWETAVETISTYPIFGPHFWGVKEKVPEGYAQRVGYYFSHNVFLDYGRLAGVPALLFYAYFFFWPAIMILRSRASVALLPFLMAHFVLFLFVSTLSFQWYKPLWAFWMLAAIVSTRKICLPNEAYLTTKTRKVTIPRQSRGL